MPYKVTGKHDVLDAKTGELVDLSRLTADEVRTLVGAGHVVFIAPAERPDVTVEGKQSPVADDTTSPEAK